jgi:hypothetical protein
LQYVQILKNGNPISKDKLEEIAMVSLPVSSLYKQALIKVSVANLMGLVMKLGHKLEGGLLIIKRKIARAAEKDKAELIEEREEVIAALSILKKMLVEKTLTKKEFDVLLQVDLGLDETLNDSTVVHILKSYWQATTEPSLYHTAAPALATLTSNRDSPPEKVEVERTNHSAEY